MKNQFPLDENTADNLKESGRDMYVKQIMKYFLLLSFLTENKYLRRFTCFILIYSIILNGKLK